MAITIGVIPAILPNEYLLGLEKLATAPSSPVEGSIYYNTVDSKIKIYKGGSWVDGTICADAI